MSDYVVDAAVKYNVDMPFDSFAALKTWSDDMANCRLATVDHTERSLQTKKTQHQKITKYMDFVSIYMIGVIVFEINLCVIVYSSKNLFSILCMIFFVKLFRCAT